MLIFVGSDSMGQDFFTMMVAHDICQEFQFNYLVMF